VPLPCKTARAERRDLARHAGDENVPGKQFETTRDGAMAFKHSADALVVTYIDASGAHLGTPRVIDDRSTGVQRRRRIRVREHALGPCAAPARVEKQNRDAAYLLVVRSGRLGDQGMRSRYRPRGAHRVGLLTQAVYRAVPNMPGRWVSQQADRVLELSRASGEDVRGVSGACQE
jgi:hypothetical protein